MQVKVENDRTIWDSEYVHSFFFLSFRGEGKCLACLDLEAKGLGKGVASSPNGGCRKSR